MKIKKIFYLVIILLLLTGLVCTCKGTDTQYGNLTFSYSGNDYNINVRELVAKNNWNIDDYPYYFVGKEYASSDILICYSKTRIYVASVNSICNEIYGNSGILIRLRIDGSIQAYNWNGSIYVTDYIASNQNVYNGGNKVYIRNQGNVYDPSHEKEKECNEVVKAIKDTVVYESAAINYDEILRLSSGDVVKRINKEVNETNGHLWDKVLLRDGKEGYVFSENLEITKDYTNINFEYNNKNYNVYFNPMQYGKNIDNYPYYLVGKDYSTDNILIAYSSTRIYVTNPGTVCNEISKDGEGFLIKLNYSNGAVQVVDWNNYRLDIKEYIASNQNVYNGNRKIYTRNQGDVYDFYNEVKKQCNEVVKTTKNTVVYEKAAMNYDEILTLSLGDIVKRINKQVYEINGHIWDKVLLRDGTTGYVFSDNLELTEDYTCMRFRYGPRNYNVYFSPTRYEKDINDYPYYLVGTDYTTNEILICYSKTRIYVTNPGTVCNEISKDGEGFLIKMKNNGEIQYADWNNYRIDIKEFITSNENIYNGNNLIYKAYMEVEDGKKYLINSDWDSIEVDPSAYRGIVYGENEYNTMSAVDHIIKDQTLRQEKQAIQLALIAISSRLPKASEALNYFLTKAEIGGTEYKHEQKPYTEGHTMRRISVADAIKENKCMKEKIKSHIKKLIEISENLNMENGSKIVLNNNTEFSGLTEDEKIGKEEDVYKDTDWHLILGSYRIKIECVIKKNENKYELDMRYGIIDYYDWKKFEDEKSYTEMLGDLKAFVGDTLAKDLRTMHIAGIARNYTNFGETTYSLTWNEGEQVEPIV